MSMAVYLPFGCGACGATQLVYNGDPNDLTLPDVDAVRCWCCRTVTRVGDGAASDPRIVDGEPLPAGSGEPADTISRGSRSG